MQHHPEGSVLALMAPIAYGGLHFSFVVSVRKYCAGWRRSRDLPSLRVSGAAVAIGPWLQLWVLTFRVSPFSALRLSRISQSQPCRRVMKVSR